MEKIITMTLSEFETFKEDRKLLEEEKYEFESNFGYRYSVTIDEEGYGYGQERITFKTKEEIFKDGKYLNIIESLKLKRDVDELKRAIRVMKDREEMDRESYCKIIENLQGKLKRKSFWEKYL